MRPDGASHAAHVRTWLNVAGRNPSTAQLLSLFQRGFAALWARAQRTLGEVTLMAIGDRVLITASEKYAFLGTLKIDETGVRFDEFLASQADRRERQLADAVRFVLAEFLSVLGTLTDEILTPALHTELSNVALAESKRSLAGVTRSTARADAGNEGSNS